MKHYKFTSPIIITIVLTLIIFLTMLPTYVIGFFIRLVGTDKAGAEHLFLQHQSQMEEIVKMLDEMPEMLISKNRNSEDTVVGNLSINSNGYLSKDQLKQIKKSGCKQILSTFGIRTAYFDLIIAKYDYVIFRISGIVEGEGIAYFKEDDIDTELSIYEKEPLGDNWYYIHFR